MLSLRHSESMCKLHVLLRNGDDDEKWLQLRMSYSRTAHNGYVYFVDIFLSQRILNTMLLFVHGNSLFRTLLNAGQKCPFSWVSVALC